jgi:DNA-binding response OmpR family regulator
MAKILVAEDERDIRELIEFALRLADFEVVLAKNGAEAIERAVAEQPDLILLDVRMPKMSGYEACRHLKENPSTSQIPVVFLSAKGQGREIEQGLDSGALEYIVKPFAPDDLADRVKGFLRRAGGQSPPPSNAQLAGDA